MISITDGLQAIYNSNMREKTPLELERENRLLRQQTDQLTNNWNELEEWLKYEIESDKRWYNPESEEYIMQKHFPDDTVDGFIYALDKMKEIKGD